MSVSGDDKQYRRGAVIGLTMAEIMILILFILLMLLGTKLEKKAAEFNEVSERLRQYEAVIPPESIDIFKEYTTIQQKIEAVNARVANIEAAPELIRVVQEIWPDKTLAEIAQEVKESSNEIKTVLETVKDVEIDTNDPKQISSDLKVCRGQLLNFQSQMKKNGLDHPPCWPNEKGGTQFIFSAHLTEGGIILSDNKIPSQVDAQSKLPIQDIKFGTPLNENSFLSATKPLFNWSVQNNCRFAMIVRDETGESSKILYKQQSRVIKDHFYVAERHVQKTSRPVEEDIPANSKTEESSFWDIFN